MRTGEGVIRSRLAVPYGAVISIEDEQNIEVGDLLFSWDPYSEPIVADFGGTIRFIDIVEEETVREELDESTGRRQLVIIEDRARSSTR
jgi:DNA-directed RNA polymerase subunit beta'